MATKKPVNTKLIMLSVAALLLFASASIALRLLLRSDAGLPAGDSAWSVTVTYTGEATNKGAAVFLPPPWDTKHARVYAQSLSHPGLRLRRTKADKKNRDIILTAPKPGEYAIESVFKIYVSHLPLSEPVVSALSEKNRASWLTSSTGIEVNTTITDSIVAGLAHGALEPGPLIESLFNFVSNNIRIDPATSNASEAALTSKRATALGSTRALVALLRSAHLPARIVTGLDLQAPTQAPQFWAEVYDGSRWLPLDPVHGYLLELPVFYIPLRKGDTQLLMTEDFKLTDIEWEIAPLPSYQGLLASDRSRPTDIFDLTRLNLPSREMLSLLLLMPLGVLATELIRQFAGIRTYGTFTPTLLALAITLVDWTTAVIVLLLVTVIGVAIRSIMPDLNLQRAARLAIVFTLVALSMSFVVSGINYFDPTADNTVTLLPMVILTMLVDRIYTVYDERGLHSAVARLFWTVVTAIVAMLVLLQAHWGTWLVSYPEAHAMTLAIIIMIGPYDGPRLKDFAAFRWLQEPAREMRNRKTDTDQAGLPVNSSPANAKATRNGSGK